MTNIMSQPQQTYQIPKMGEKELLNDLLNQEKQLISSYTMAISEASCPNLRNVMMQQFNQCVSDQLAVFDQMSSRGYYPVKDAPDQDVQQAKQTMTQLQSQLMS